MRPMLLSLLGLSALSFASAAPVTYKVVNKPALNLLTAESNTSVENFVGRTSQISGSLMFDAAAKTGSGTVIINGASITTGMSMRDGHMRSADWFNFDETPSIKFQTTAVKYVSGDNYDITGLLTLNGVSKPVQARATLKLTAANATTKAAGLSGDAVAVSTSFPIKLSDYKVKNRKIGGQVNDTLNVSLKFVASN